MFKFNLILFYLPSLCIAVILLELVPLLVFAQHQQLQVSKSRNSEVFTVPYDVSNRDRSNPFIYNYTEPKIHDWILNIQNNFSYAMREDAKTIVRLHEPTPSDKFIEIAMFGGQSMRFWVAVNSPEVGYSRIYELDHAGWSTDSPVSVGYEAAQGLSVSDGKRIVVDRLNINGFTLGSISIYGKDDATSNINSYGGDMSFDLAYGNPADSPLYYVPVGITVGAVALIGGLLVAKKRRDYD